MHGAVGVKTSGDRSQNGMSGPVARGSPPDPNPPPSPAPNHPRTSHKPARPPRGKRILTLTPAPPGKQTELLDHAWLASWRDQKERYDLTHPTEQLDNPEPGRDAVLQPQPARGQLHTGGAGEWGSAPYREVGPIDRVCNPPNR